MYVHASTLVTTLRSLFPFHASAKFVWTHRGCLLLSELPVSLDRAQVVAPPFVEFLVDLHAGVFCQGIWVFRICGGSWVYHGLGSECVVQHIKVPWCISWMVRGWVQTQWRECVGRAVVVLVGFAPIRGAARCCCDMGQDLGMWVRQGRVEGRRVG